MSGRDLDEASHVIFRQEDAKRAKLSHETAMLRQLMIRTGRTSERMARIHYTLVCLDRMAKFTLERCREWIAQDVASRLQSVSSDIASLVQFAEGLVSRVQLLQDAATGIINIDQNDVMKVLTIASVVGIPPVLVVGIYGMNFKNMPELDWAWGYPYALALIAVTALCRCSGSSGRTGFSAPRPAQRGASYRAVGWPWIFGRSAGPLCLACCALLARSTVKRSATSGDICAKISAICRGLICDATCEQHIGIETD